MSECHELNDVVEKGFKNLNLILHLAVNQSVNQN